MAEYTVELHQLGGALRAGHASNLAAVVGGLYEAALRGMPKIVEATPTDRGHAKLGWNVRQVPNGADLYNDAPHIGILEMGRRAGKRPPLMPILRWLVRKAGLDLNGGARSFDGIKEVPWTTYLAAKSICAKIEREGSKPHGMIANNIDYLTRLAKQTIERRLRSSQSFNDDDLPF